MLHGPPAASPPRLHALLLTGSKSGGRSDGSGMAICRTTAWSNPGSLDARSAGHRRPRSLDNEVYRL